MHRRFEGLPFAKGNVFKLQAFLDALEVFHQRKDRMQGRPVLTQHAVPVTRCVPPTIEVGQLPFLLRIKIRIDGTRPVVLLRIGHLAHAVKGIPQAIGHAVDPSPPAAVEGLIEFAPGRIRHFLGLIDDLPIHVHPLKIGPPGTGDAPPQHEAIGEAKIPRGRPLHLHQGRRKGCRVFKTPGNAVHQGEELVLCLGSNEHLGIRTGHHGPTGNGFYLGRLPHVTAVAMHLAGRLRIEGVPLVVPHPPRRTCPIGEIAFCKSRPILEGQPLSGLRFRETEGLHRFR